MLVAPESVVIELIANQEIRDQIVSWTISPQQTFGLIDLTLAGTRQKKVTLSELGCRRRECCELIRDALKLTQLHGELHVIIASCQHNKASSMRSCGNNNK